MTPISFARCARLREYVRPLEDPGSSTDRHLAQSGLSRWLRCEDEDWIPATKIGDALELGARIAGSHHFGLWLAEQVADIATIDSRALKRRLAEERTTYRELVDQVGYHKAREMLEDPATPIKEIRPALGYSNLPEFYNAF